MGAGNDQHGDGADNGLIRAADDCPDDGRNNARGQGEPEEQSRGPIRQCLRAGRRILCFGNHALNTSQGGISANLFHSDAHGVIGSHGAGDNCFATVAIHRLGFTGDHRFVEFGETIDDGAVSRHSRARSD